MQGIRKQNASNRKVKAHIKLDSLTIRENNIEVPPKGRTAGRGF